MISGYLITSILFEDMDKNKFSFTNFYARRIKRLYPSLMIVLITAIVYGWFVLLPEEYRLLTKHAAASSVYMNNFVLYKENGYFDVASNCKPLLHLWSLSIEEQFYLIWPLMLYFLKRKKLPVGTIILAGLIFSFSLNIYYVYHNHSYAFYMPTTRFWELLVGAALAYITTYKSSSMGKLENCLNKYVNTATIQNLSSLLGGFLIGIGVACLNQSSLFPGWWALLPTAGAFLLIFAGQQAWFNTTVLSNKLMRGIGLISYPLYLWHWPILSFCHIIKGESLPYQLTCQALGLSFVLAYLTYKFIESPTRRQQNWIALPLGLGMIPTILIAWSVKHHYHQSHAATNVATAQVVKAIGEWDFPNGLTMEKFNGREIHTLGSQSKRALFFGDSNIQQYAPRIKKLILENPQVKRSATFITYGGCPPLPNVYDDKRPELEDFVGTAVKYASRPDVDVIVIGGQWMGYLGKKGSYYYRSGNTQHTLEQGNIGLSRACHDFMLMLKTWVDSGKKVYLVLNMPVSFKCDPIHMLERKFFDSISYQPTVLPAQEWHTVAAISYSELIKVAEKAGVTVIDPTLSLCDKEQCQVLTVTGEPIYKDGCHLRPTFVENHVTYLDQVLF
ncbi:acyltransferase family protein [Candidatus Odyssella thessalonicensis]|uniref:acyltransferase family protein n=1 Tax=Candidatus Odyssella thessalonicensis TaxID=84647 RepID=UPI0004974AD2|nr:acyltransferase family protein [Candidatus Odyssella thessalonicensis]